MGCLVRIIALVLVASRLAFQVGAQATTTAICTTAAWTFNQENQSPCLVAASLQGACHGGVFTVPALLAGQQYEGPLLGFSNACICSTVTYSMVSACATCQGEFIGTWPDWKTNCTASQISLSSFPVSIPSGTTVPSWAYLDVATSGVWDSTAANTDHNNGAADSSASGPSATATTTPGTNGASSSGGSKTPVAAIAGGVAGGVVGLLLIIGLVFFLVRRNKRSRSSAPSTQYVQGGLPGGEKFDPSLYPQSPVPPPMPYYVNTSQAPGVTQLQSVPQMEEDRPKLYNPQDPSTFPSLEPNMTSDYTSRAPSGAPYSDTVSLTTYDRQAPPASYDGQAPIPPYDGQVPTTPYGSQAPTAATPYLSEPTSPTRPFSQQMFGGNGYAAVPTAPSQQVQTSQGPAQGYSGMAEL